MLSLRWIVCSLNMWTASWMVKGKTSYSKYSLYTHSNTLVCGKIYFSIICSLLTIPLREPHRNKTSFHFTQRFQTASGYCWPTLCKIIFEYIHWSPVLVDCLNWKFLLVVSPNIWFVVSRLCEGLLPQVGTFFFPNGLIKKKKTAFAWGWKNDIVPL